MSLPIVPEDCGYDHARAVELAKGTGVTDEEIREADVFAEELQSHHAWGLPFNGYCNAAGYGYVRDPTMAVAQDGWDSHRAFLQLSRGAQTTVVYGSLERGRDVDRESARQFLKHERGIIIHGNQPY